MISTKIPGLVKKFNLSDLDDRQNYYQAKAGEEILKLRKFLEKNTFMINMVGKKNSGKGTYSQLFSEAIGGNKIVLISVGDVVRDLEAKWSEISGGKEIEKIKKNYRGYISFEDAVAAFLGRSQKTLIPTEFILALLKYKIDEYKGKAIIIDGMPRELDQVSYSLYFRDVINYRDDPDVFALIDIPETLIDLRIKTRSVCPICHSTRNIMLHPTKFVGYDKEKKEFYLMCDKPDCHKAKFVRKEGDDQGIAPLRTRLDKEAQVISLINKIHGVPKVYLQNSVSVEDSDKYFDDYELTPEFRHELDKDGSVVTKKLPLIFKDDNGIDSIPTLPAAITITFIKQMVDVLNI